MTGKAVRHPWPAGPVRAVSFDCGGTLVTLKPLREERFVAAARDVGLELTAAAVRRAYEIAEFGRPYSSLRVCGPEERSAFYRELHERVCLALGVASRFECLQPRLTAHFAGRAEWHLVDGATTILAGLHEADVPLVVAANWDRDLPDLLERLGIGHYFRGVVASQAAGVEKPDGRLFRRALEALPSGTLPSQVIHVGDDYQADVLGARGAGLVPVLIDPWDRQPHADCPRFPALAGEFADLILGRLREPR